MNELFIVLFWALIGSVVSLAGGLLLVKSKHRERFTRWALPFGAGALLAVSFLDLLLEAVHMNQGGEKDVLIASLIGFLLFFILERSVHWFHHHHDHGDSAQSRGKAQQSLIVFGDTLHNLIDGLAIGAAFLISVPTGIVTALAVAAHEIPQEIGDFGFLLSRGMPPKKALIVNILSSLATVIGAIGIYLVGAQYEVPLWALLAITAGFFIYIAASDIIPEIHERPHDEANKQAGILLLGVIVIALISSMMTHSHGGETGHGDHSHDHEDGHYELIHDGHDH